MSFLSMTKTLFKNLFRSPYTVEYPIVKKEKFERTRGSIDIDIDTCIFCGICQRRCPTGAINVDKAGKMWSIDRLNCIQCGYCCEVCPKKCLSMEQQYTYPATGKSRDEFYARVPDNEADN